MDAGERAARNVQLAWVRACGNDEVFDRDFFARSQVQPLAWGIDAGDFGVELQFNAVRAVEFVGINFYAIFRIFAGEETFRKRRPFIGNGIIRGDDGQLAWFQPALCEFFGGVTGYHASA